MASIKQRENGAWRARYRDESGHEHARHFKLKRDAQRWLDEVAATVVTGVYVDPRAGKLTWAQWVERWADKQVWAPGTLEGVRTAVDSVPWKDAPISSVRQSDVQGWVAREVKRGLAASTMTTRLNHVRSAFRAAVVDRLISTSPAAGVKAPRARKREASMEILTVDQVWRVLEVAGTFRPFVEVCLFAGLRLGEAAGLQLGDVSFLGRTIDVRRQVQGATNTTAQLVPPKYGSERTIYVPAALTDSLAAHVTREGVTRLDELLFLTPLHHLWQRNSAGEQWRRIRELAGLSADVTLHTLRHTFASNLIAQGCDVVTVQRALGHASPSITLNVYSHLWPSAEDKTRNATADFMASIAGSADAARTETGKAQVRALP